jgi:hypothetical protein
MTKYVIVITCICLTRSRPFRPPRNPTILKRSLKFSCQSTLHYNSESIVAVIHFTLLVLLYENNIIYVHVINFYKINRKIDGTKFTTRPF